MATHQLGIDIHPAGISAVLMLSRLKSASVVGHWEIPYTDGLYSPGALSAAVTALMAEAGIDSCDCAVGIPASWVYFRQVTLPFRDKKKIDKVLPYEVEPLLPLAADDLLVDYHIAVSGDTDTVLMTAAMEKTLLAEIIDSLKACGLNPGVLTFSGYPAMALLERSGDAAGDVVLLTMAAHHVTIVLGNGQRILSARYLDGAMAPIAPARIAAGVRQTILSFQDGRAGVPFAPRRIFLSGPEPDITALSAALSRQSDLPAAGWHPADALESPRAIDADIPLRELPAGAFSLALGGTWGFKGPNFRKGPFAASKFWRENRKSLIAPALIGLLILLTAGYRSMSSINDYQRRLDAVDRQIAQAFRAALPEVRRMVNPVQQMRTRLSELRQEAPQFDQTTPARRVVDIMHSISARIPADVAVVLNQLVVNPGTVLIGGETDSFNAVNTVQQRLETEPMFKSVSISSANQQKAGNRVNFRIRITL